MPVRTRLGVLTAASAALLAAAVWSGGVSSAKEPSSPAQPESRTGENRTWTPLFDGKSLEGWKRSDFIGGGDVAVADGAIVLGTGDDLTGVNAAREMPKVNYEVELEAMRAEGSDFFCGLTFPVADQFCSLIVGGWGGGVIGLSSLNGFDASENETTEYRKFENGKWYPIRLRVTANRITAWIDGKEAVDVDVRDAKLSIRLEVESSKPFGIASWRTKALLRKIRIRELTADEVRAVDAEAADDE